MCAVVLAACGGDKPAPTESKPEPAPKPAPAAPPAQEEAAPAAPAPTPPATGALTPDADGVVHVTGNDQMQYNATRIEVPAGKPVKIELKHVGNLAVEAMGHNLVILKPGTDPMQFAASAIAAKATDYIPPGSEATIVGHTKLLGGGQSDTLELAALAPGTYPYLCTFPGHAGIMKGELVVVE